MSAPTETVKRFYDRLKAGDVPGLVELMAEDIAWETMLDFGLDERGPQPIIDTVLAPLMDEWTSFSPEPSEFIIAEHNTVVSVGTFTCVHRATEKRASASYAHIWTVQDPPGVLHVLPTSARTSAAASPGEPPRRRHRATRRHRHGERCLTHHRSHLSLAHGSADTSSVAGRRCR